MAAPVYADSTDLAAWTGVAAPANATRLLRSAALLVRTATAADVHAVDSAGLPTDATLLTAMQEATCAQVAAWVALGIDPAGGAPSAPAVVTSRTQGGRSESYAVDATTTAETRTAVTTLCPESVAILRQAGLASAGVWAA